MKNKVIAYVAQFERDLWVLSIGWFASALGFSVSIPFISIYFHTDLGLSITQIGLFFGAMAVVRSAFQIIGGEISDRIERRFLLIDSQIIRAVSFVLMALAVHYHWGFWAVSLSLLINSIFGAIFQPAANAMVADILPREKRLDGYAITRSATNLGWACGPAMGGFLAAASYGLLFLISGVITCASGLILWRCLRVPPIHHSSERFRFADILVIRKDGLLANHSVLIFLLYLVVSQLIAPFSVYVVDMVGLSEQQLGLLYTLNGMIVVVFQVPMTRFLSKWRFTNQLAAGAFVYTLAYGFVGFCDRFELFVIAIALMTAAEIIMSPPALALTARLAPDGKMGRYMGIFGFFVTSGWSLGPLYGGIILDVFGHHHPLAWSLIASLALLSGLGYLRFTQRLPKDLNTKPSP